jgi:hypothetical protein
MTFPIMSKSTRGQDIALCPACMTQPWTSQWKRRYIPGWFTKKGCLRVECQVCGWVDFFTLNAEELV